MPVTLVDHRFRDVPCRVAQSATCTGRRVHRPYPLRRPVHLVLIPAMESVLPAEPEPIQRMFEDARSSAPIQSSFGAATHPSIGGVAAYATFCSYRGRQPAGKGPRQVPERDDIICTVRHDASAPRGRRYCTTPRRSGGRLPGQPFEFRNQMLECFEIADCCH